MSIELVPSRRKASEICLLDLPSKEDVIPVDHVLYDLVEGVTLMVIGIPCISSKKDKITHVQSSVCIRWTVMKDEQRSTQVL